MMDDNTKAELLRTAEIIGAQCFDDLRLAKTRRIVLVSIVDRLLLLADDKPVMPRNSHHDHHRSVVSVRSRFPDDLLPDLPR